VLIRRYRSGEPLRHPKAGADTRAVYEIASGRIAGIVRWEPLASQATPLPLDDRAEGSSGRGDVAGKSRFLLAVADAPGCARNDKAFSFRNKPIYRSGEPLRHPKAFPPTFIPDMVLGERPSS
jgi:hypothetical protein